MADSPVTDELWDSFHQWVNMSSRELREWLSTDEAGETAEAFPDQAGSERSRGVLNILTKRRTDLNEEDVELMAEVVDRISTLRAEEDEEVDALEPRAGDDEWRRQLMSLGHDPLKPVT
ncbi:MAG TPA: DUF3140 domain-containing protein [Beutenbergiaceae bacterium]|nr:DUF3140 domain-containing protein [Beutenbergiaceae bacterium]